MESEQPMKILRTWPNLEENEIIKLSLSFIPELPEKLYDLIARHGYDRKVLKNWQDFRRKININSAHGM